MEYLKRVGIVFQREVHIAFTCIDDTAKKFSRIDAVIDCPERNLRILIEVDENQHAGYQISCEVARMMDSAACIRLGGETRKLLWLRLNPDAYKTDGSTIRTPKKDRYKHMERVIRTYVPTRDMAVMYLYYSTQDGVPCIVDDPEYPSSFKDFIIINNV